MAENVEKDQQTEEATPRRRQEARERGQVPLSTEFLAAVLLAGWASMFAATGGRMAESIGRSVSSGIEALTTVGTGDLDVAEATRILAEAGRGASASLGIFLGPLLLLGVLVGYGQVGFRVTPQAIAFDPAKINPIKGLERLFSLRSVVRTALAFAKIALIGLVMTIVAWLQLGDIANLAGSEVGPVLRAIGHVVLSCAAAAVVTVLVLGLIDLGYQRFQHERDLRMSKQEVRDDMKNSEGDPHLKARVRRVQREMASRRMMADVPKATVVVTNPTHYAVALRYDRDEETGAGRGAPVVVAKGVDHVAERIKEIAREAEVLCYEDVPLARALHAQCEIGDEIPVDLFQAVATVLAYVYRVQGEQTPVRS